MYPGKKKKRGRRVKVRPTTKKKQQNNNERSRRERDFSSSTLTQPCLPSLILSSSSSSIFNLYLHDLLFKNPNFLWPQLNARALRFSQVFLFFSFCWGVALALMLETWR